jgi:RNA-directed DNA polymerase
VLPGLQADLLAGTYQPGGIRRVFIPKAGGGQRGLGIPDVIDRVVQEAVRQVLEPLWEPTFHPSSHGFRPGRSRVVAPGRVCPAMDANPELDHGAADVQDPLW